MTDFKAFIEELKDAAKIEQIIAETGQLTVYRRGKYFSTKEHDSLSIDAGRGWFEWYSKADGPGARGDVLEWLQHWGGYPDFKDAIRYLSDKTGIHFDWGPEETAAFHARKARDQALTIIAGYLHAQLLKTPAALDYARGRGWSDETIKAARLGWWDGNRKGLLEHLKFHEVDANLSAVVAVKEMPAQMVVYNHHERGQCVYMQGRTITGERRMWNLKADLAGPRRPYWNHVYNFLADYVVVVEGQADAISLAQWDIPAVALAGSAADDDLKKQLGRQRVYVALDGDDPGQKAAGKLAAALGPATLVVSWPGDGDVNDWLKSGATAEDCIKRLAAADIYAVWLARRVHRAEPLQRDDARKRVFEVAAGLDPYNMAMAKKKLLALLETDASSFNAVIGAFKKQVDVAERQPTTAPTTPEEHVAGKRELDPFTKGLLLKKKPDHQGHAECLMAMYAGQFCYVKQWGWLYYNGRFWEEELAEAKITEAIVDVLRKRQMVAAGDGNRPELIKATFCSRHNIRGVRDQLQDLLLTPTDVFDRSPDHFNCKNGVIDLRTGQLMPHAPDQYFTYCADVAYEPDADDMFWLTFLASSLDPERGGIELLDFLQVAIGYSLTGHTREECLFYVYGPTRSGKGTFTETVKALLGKPLSTEVDFMTLTAQRHEDTNNFDLAHLKPSRFLVAAESDKYSRINASKLKSMTGGDEIRCARKHREHFTYRPQFKIWLTSNWPLNLDVDDDAAWGRARVIHFPNSRLGKEDKTLKERLRQTEGLQGVLAWAVKGAIRWYQDGLHYPETVREAGKDMRERQDVVKMWLDECCTYDPFTYNIYTPVKEVYTSYKIWCEEASVKPMQARSFWNSMEIRGLKEKRPDRSDNRERVHGTLTRVRYGILINEKDGGATGLQRSFFDPRLTVENGAENGDV